MRRDQGKQQLWKRTNFFLQINFSNPLKGRIVLQKRFWCIGSTYDRKYLGIHGVGDSLPNWHYEAFVAERYGDAEIGVLEGHAGLVVTAVQL